MTTTPGKNFPGQKGFPTPNDVPEDSGYIVFRFPNNNEWAGLLLGAAQLLTQHFNFYDWGELTTFEAADAWQAIVDSAPYQNCGCTRPGGGKIIRQTADGHFEELGEDGEWHEPSGDYAIPAVPAREGGTAEDQKCLAAANAAHVLELLYEQLSDDWAHGVSDAEAITNLLLGIAALIAAPFGLIGEAVIAIAALVFNVIYETIEFVGADLWDSTFTDAIKCIFLGCCTNVEGVVTFDLDCINNKLAEQTNPFDLTANQIRLFGQIQYIFSIIGVDGLNSAGATTAITDPDCSACDDTWCYTWDFTIDDGGWSLNPDLPYGTYTSGVGWESAGGLGGRVLFVTVTMPAAGTVTRCEAVFIVDADNPNNNFSLSVGTTNYLGGDHAGEGENDVAFSGDPVTSDQLFWGQGNGEGSGDGNGGSFRLTRVTISGTGANPFGEDNC